VSASEEANFHDPKVAATQLRVSTLDQHPENQLLDLQQLAQQRGMEIVETYTAHGVGGTRTRRPALDKLMTDAARHVTFSSVCFSCIKPHGAVPSSLC
jgi:hypothetical protein